MMCKTLQLNMLFNPSHPGEVLKDYLGDITVKEAAISISMPATRWRR